MNTFLLGIKIFFIRNIDVSLGTVRQIVMIKGKALIASIIAFFEVLLWFLVVREALTSSDSGIFVAICYSLGMATGTYVGTLLSGKFITGTLGVQVVLSSKNKDVVKTIKDKGYAMSVVDINTNSRYMLFIEINRKKLNNLKSLIKNLDPKAFIVVNETKTVYNGYFK